MKTFDLTAKELRAAALLTAQCLSNMGGKRPIDLDCDPYTWVDGKDLMQHGYSQHEAAGLFSSLNAKGFIDCWQDRINGKNVDVAAVSTDGYRWMDTVWDEIMKEIEAQKAKAV